jgi:hypothetical protein
MMQLPNRTSPGQVSRAASGSMLSQIVFVTLAAKPADAWSAQLSRRAVECILESKPASGRNQVKGHNSTQITPSWSPETTEGEHALPAPNERIRRG